jgi:hypothetical protein
VLVVGRLGFRGRCERLDELGDPFPDLGRRRDVLVIPEPRHDPYLAEQFQLARQPSQFVRAAGPRGRRQVVDDIADLVPARRRRVPLERVTEHRDHVVADRWPFHLAHPTA